MTRLLLTLLVAFVPSTALAETVMTCGESTGHAFFHTGPLVPPEKAGFKEDAITEGKTSLVRKQDGKYGILFVDATGSIKSVEDQGGVIVPFAKASGGLISLLLLYPDQLTEIYAFNPQTRKLVLLQHKYNSFVNKSAVYESDCF